MAWVVAVAVLAAALLTLYAWWTARRLDRLHVRLDAAAAALDGHLVRRAEAATRAAARLQGLADEPGLVAAGDALAASARAALLCRRRLDRDREFVENTLSAVIAETVEPLPVNVVAADPVGVALLDQSTRAAFARRFYNDAVRDVLVVRDRRVVRWLHLAGRAPLPAYLEMDDDLLPAALLTAGATAAAATAENQTVVARRGS